MARLQKGKRRLYQLLITKGKTTYELTDADTPAVH